MKLRLLPPTTVVTSPAQATPVLQYLMNRGGLIAIDTETTGLDPVRARVLFWSMATEDRRYFLTQDMLEYFRPLFERPDITWLLANAKFDMHMLANMMIKLAGSKWDIIVMDAMDDDTRPHGLKEQAHLAYEVSWGEFKELFLDPDVVARLFGMSVEQARYLMRPTLKQWKSWSVGDRLCHVYNERPDIVQEYASCDAFFTYVRAVDLANILASTPLPTVMASGMETSLDYFQTLESPLTDALWEMERNGFRVDLDQVKRLDQPMKAGLDKYVEQMRALSGSGDKFTGKPDQVRDALFRKFKLKPVKYSVGKGKATETVNKAAIDILVQRTPKDTPAGKFLVAYQNFSKLKTNYNTFIRKMGLRFPPETRGEVCRVHCKVNQAVARTSRLSTSEPSLQNIPIRNDPYGIRSIFVADPGCVLVDADYPQIEFRIVAALAGEEKMMEACRRGWDIHSANGAGMYGGARDQRVTYEAIQEARRRKDEKLTLAEIDKICLKVRENAKTVGLAALYGEGARKMAAQLGITQEEAQNIIDEFFDTYPNIWEFIQSKHFFGHKYGMTHTMLGRIRRLHRINNETHTGIVLAEERQALNTVVQGSGAEMMKLAILRLWSNKDFRSIGGKLTMTIHDELISNVPKEFAKEGAEIQKAMMDDPFRWGPINFEFPVPITPDYKIANCWLEAK